MKKNELIFTPKTWGMPKRLLLWIALLLTIYFMIVLLKDILLPFVLSFIISYLLSPLVDKMEHYKVSRSLSASIFATIYFIVLLFTALFILPTLYKQVIFFIEQAPEYILKIQIIFDSIISHLNNRFGILNYEAADTDIYGMVADFFNKNAIDNVNKDILNHLVHSGFLAINFIIIILITPMISYHMIKNWHHIKHLLVSLVPIYNQSKTSAIVRDIDLILSRYIRGQIVLIIILTILYSIGLSVAQLRYSLVMATMAGLFSIIPYIGVSSVCIFSVIVSFIQYGSLYHVILVLSVFAVIQIVDSIVLTPNLLGRSIGINPCWIIFGIFAGGSVLGFVGILLSVPLTAICTVLLRFVILEYKRSDLYCGS